MYLSNAIVINKSSRRNVKLDLVKVIQEESYTITDTAKRAHVMLRIQISPKCSQTYHSPELLQVHFKHFHDQDTPIIQSAGTAKRAHVMLRCEHCDDIIEDLENHLLQSRKSVYS